MNKVEIYESVRDCSTGVCGPGMDRELIRVSAMINALNVEGKIILRHCLSEKPQIFVMNHLVNDVLLNEGIKALPITVVDGEIKKRGLYPSNTELATWCGMTKDQIKVMIIKNEKAASCGGCSGSKGGSF